MANAWGPRVGKTSEWTSGVSYSGDKYGNKYISTANYKFEVYAYRNNKFNDPRIVYSVLVTAMNAWLASDALIFGDVDADYSRHYWLYSPDGKKSLINTSGIGSGAGQMTTMLDGPFANRQVLGIQQYGPGVDNYDLEIDGLEFLFSKVGTIILKATTNISGISGTTDTQNRAYWYPPYRPFPPENPDPKNPITKGGTSGTSDCISLNRQYKIIKAASGYNCNLSWDPSTTSFTAYGQTWSVQTRMVRGSTEVFGWQQRTSPYVVYGSSLSTGSSYNYYVQRRSPDEGTTYQSNTTTLYTYSIPTLSNLSVSPTSQRANAEIQLTYTRNNKVHDVENNYKTVIWSNHHTDKSYINEFSRDASRTLTSANLKVLFPDTKANNNGVTTGTIYIRRDNVGVSGGNPSSGIVYSSSTLSSNISVYYKPQYAVDKTSLTKRRTNNIGYLYDLTDTVHDDYSFENLYFGWTHDSTSNTAGEVDGYRIVFIDSDGQRYAADIAGGRNVSGNDGYFKDASKGYTVNMDNIRHMTNQKIEITPYYNASNGTKWYGPSQTWDIGIRIFCRKRY